MSRQSSLHPKKEVEQLPWAEWLEAVATADFYDEYGWAFTYQGQHDRALEYYEKALAIRLDTLGAEHPDVGWSYNSLGIAYNDQGDNDKAIEYYNKALAIYLETLGAEHSFTKAAQERLDALR